MAQSVALSGMLGGKALVMVGGGLLGLGALTLALGLGAAGVSALFYVGLWLVSRGVG